MKRSTSGFTIVELLIVIVVIAILAAISVVAYGGVRNRAEDNRRINDLKSIAKALEMYNIDNGRYPAMAYSGLGAQWGWETSSREAEGEFIAPIKDYGFSNGVPVDPVNNATEQWPGDARANGSYGYSYYRYPAGTGGCNLDKGGFYVLGALTTVSAGTAKHPESPGFMCSDRDWQDDFSWVIGEYENG